MEDYGNEGSYRMDSAYTDSKGDYVTKEKSMDGASKVDFFAGFRDEVYYIDEVKKYVNEVKVSTESGSQGHKGFVTEIFNPEDYDVILCCGPEVMMRTLQKKCLNSTVTIRTIHSVFHVVTLDANSTR